MGFPHQLFFFARGQHANLVSIIPTKTLAMGVIFRKPCDCLTFIYEHTERSTVYFPVCPVWGGLFF